MKTYSYTFAAGQRLMLPLGGTFFYLVDAPTPVDIEFVGPNSQGQGEKIELAIAGDWMEPDGGFSQLIITSAAAQTIKFLIAAGRAGRNSVVGSVAIAGTVPTTDVAMLPGTNFVSGSSLVANTPMNILAAASNLNGVRVHAGSLISANLTAYAGCTLVAKATAPATAVDGILLMAPHGAAAINALFLAFARLDKPIRLAAGLRLDFMVGTSDTATSAKFLAYDIL